MTNEFQTVFQSPFKNTKEKKASLAPDEVVLNFKAIDWLDLVKKINDDVVEYFYYYETQYTDTQKQEYVLLLSGEYSYGEELIKKGPLFSIHYSRPVTKTSRGFLGLGSPKTKTTNEVKIVESQELAFAEKCLMAFVNKNFSFLESSL